jgi:DNA polymerase-3 subunit beta
MYLAKEREPDDSLLGGATSTETSFSMPSKMVGVVRGIIGKVQNEVVGMEFNDRQVRMTAGDYVLVGRLTEGRYPNYNAVIPQDHPLQVMIDRQALSSALRRMMVFASDSSGLIALKIEDNMMTLNAEDLEFNSKAEEKIGCRYEAEAIRIGFKGSELLNVLSNINSDEVVLKLIDATRPGIFVPSEDVENEELLALLMPMLLMDE